MAFSLGDRVKWGDREHTYFVAGFVDVPLYPTKKDAETGTKRMVGVLHEKWMDADLGEAHWTYVDASELSPV